MRGLLALLVVAALVLSACDDADRAIADESVQTFHRQYDASDFHAIYVATAEQFRNRTPEEDWSRSLTAVHQKAGVIVATRQASWRVDSSTAGTTVALVYTTTFEKLSAVESFVWRMQSGKAQLTAYRIESPDLVGN